MFKLHEIREIIKLVEQSAIQELEIESDDTKVTLRKRGGIVFTNEVERIEPSHPEPVSLPAAVTKSQVVVEETLKPAVQTIASPAENKLPSSSEVTEQNLYKITSPMVGTFYRAPSEDAAPYVKPGDSVQKSSIVCIIEAMKLFNEIEAEVEGEIVQVLVENGQVVEAGQPLFLVKTE
jgi:acetyl-CoA carboxylase biotin carboxyl carrier protein